MEIMPETKHLANDRLGRDGTRSLFWWDFRDMLT